MTRDGWLAFLRDAIEAAIMEPTWTPRERRLFLEELHTDMETLYDRIPGPEEQQEQEEETHAQAPPLRMWGWP